MEMIIKRVNELILLFYGIKFLLIIYLNIEFKEVIKRIEKWENCRLLLREKKGLRKVKLLYEKYLKEMKIINSN